MLTRRRALEWCVSGFAALTSGGCTPSETRVARLPPVPTVNLDEIEPIPAPEQVDLEKLRQVNGEIITRLYRGLGEVGLYLDAFPDGSRRWSTPKNCQTFAKTGGDGVHFSLLLLGNGKPTPVVVTIPLGGSYIVGESLHEFLCLGCQRGYYALEQIVYQPELTMQAYTDPAWKPTNRGHHSVGFAPDQEERVILSVLTRRLALQPWNDPKRFAELKAKYEPLLVDAP